MLVRDLIAETYTAIAVNKARTVLTILGIVIGIGSVITMTAVGRGAQSEIEERIQSIGSNLLTVSPGAERGFGPAASGGSADSLTLEDVALIQEISQYIGSIAPQASTRAQVIAGNENINTTILGTTHAYVDVRSVKMAQGTFISDIDNQRLSRVAVLGSEALADLFGEDSDPIGKQIRISDAIFTIIGVTEATGTNDDRVYAPLSTVQQYLIGEKTVSTIDVSVINADDMTAADAELTEILLTAHDIKDTSDADFRIRNQAEIVETASSVTGAFTALLGAIASISLLVGGIGIMNMMLTSVTERTREIGLRKSLGATVGDIRLQFLLEAITLTLFGGIAGVMVGVGLAWVLDTQLGLSADVSQTSIILAFGVSVLIGVIFGFYPAWRASKLDPMTALRYE